MILSANPVADRSRKMVIRVLRLESEYKTELKVVLCAESKSEVR